MPDLREKCERLAERLPPDEGRAWWFQSHADGSPAELFVNLKPYEGSDWLPSKTIPIPAPDAPLHEHLAFVGRIATALPEGWRLVQVEDEDAGYGIEPAWVVRFWGRKDGTKVGRAPSPTEAAVDAALAVLEETT